MANLEHSRDIAAERAIRIRDHARLRALERRHRFRAVATRGARGAAGFALTLAMTFKLKIAATIGGKLAIAALIGLGFAWPAIALTVLAVGVIVLSVVAIFAGESCSVGDCPCDCVDCGDCRAKNARRERLLKRIAAYEDWLKTGAGPPPDRRSGARGTA